MMKDTKVKVIIKSIVSVVLFLVLLAVCTYNVDRTLKDKGNFLKYESFYEEDEPFDVLFFGSSRMLDGVYPMELWDEFGLTSYNMAQHSEGIKVSYWQMKNAFQYNTPKVAVVDVSLLHGGKIEKQDEETLSYLHKSLDHMPISKVKYDAMKDITEGVEIGEYLFPLAMYHNRWNDLERNDIYVELPCRKGAEARVAIHPLVGVEWSSEEINEEVDTEDIRLDAMVALCEEKGVQLVLTLMPAVGMAATENVCTSVNYLEVYAKEHNIPFLNFAKEDDIINYSIDFHDPSHLNPCGAKKVTKAIGDFLTANYDFPAKTEKTKSTWQKFARDYMGVKLGEIIIEAEAENLNYYLLLLNDNDFRIEIKMPDASSIDTWKIQDILNELETKDTEIIFDDSMSDVEVTVYEKETGEYFHSARFSK